MSRWPFRRLHRDQSGAALIVTGLAMAMSIGCLALGVDLGSIYLESRRLQGSADAGALAAVTDLNGPNAAVSAIVQANGWSRPVDIDVTVGHYASDPAIAPKLRFSTGGAGVGAAKVTLTTDAQLYFGIVALARGTIRISRSATAAKQNVASFSLGSRLAGLQGGIANQLLSGLTGSEVSLSLMDYNALLGAQIDLLAFSKSLGSQLNLSGASFDTILQTKMTSGQALSALAAALSTDRAGSAAAAVAKLASAANDTSIDLGRLIDLGAIGAQDHAAPGQGLSVNAYDLVQTVLQAAAGSRQIKLDLGASIPGVTKTDIYLAIGDRAVNSPWVTVTDNGEPILRTSQTRLYVDSRIGASPLLGALGISAVRLPLYVELAEAQARLSGLTCSRAGNTVTLQVQPSIGHVSIADVAPSALADHGSAVTESAARIVSIPLVSISGQARVDATQPGWQSLSFNGAEISSHAIKTVSSTSLVQGLVASLVSKLNLNVNVLGIGFSTSLIGSAVGALLSGVAPALDQTLNAITDMLGVHLGQADARVNGVRCGLGALVA